MHTTSFASIKHEASVSVPSNRRSVQRPGREETGRQWTHRWSRWQVLVLGLDYDLGIFLHFRQLGHALGKEGRDILDESVDGMDRIEAVLDELLDAGHVGPAFHLA